MKGFKGLGLAVGFAAMIASAAPAVALPVAVTYIVTYDAPPTVDDVETLLGVALAVHPYEHIPAAAVVALPSDKRIIAAAPGVRRVYDNDRYDLLLRQSTHSIGADRVWDLGVAGNGVGVAIIDTGIDGTHPDLCARAEFCRGTAVKTVQNVKLIGRQDVAVDPVVVLEDQINTDTSSGHGTHVAGIAASAGVASVEPGKYRGVAKGANLIGLGTGEVLEAVNVLAAYDYAIDNRDAYNIRVINNSWGPGEGVRYDSGDPVNLATDAAWNAGISVVFGAGNAGPKTDTMNAFSVHPRAISAAAATKDGHIAFFSSRGVPGSPLWHPTVTAPGYNIVSDRSSTGFYGDFADLTSANPDMPVPEDVPYYATASGTSMAAPHVAGVIALMQEAAHDARGVWLTPAEVRNILQNTAISRDPARGPGGLPNYQSYSMGAGHVDAFAAAQAAAAGTGMQAYDDGVAYDVDPFAGAVSAGIFGTGGGTERTVLVADGALSLNVMVEWAVTANDIDIDLYNPSGVKVLSTSFLCSPAAEPNGYSSFCTQAPNERLSVPNPAPGQWRAVINGTVSASDSFTGRWSIAYQEPTTLTAAQAATVSVSATPAASVVGQRVDLLATVRDASGLPVPNAPVIWTSAGVGWIERSEGVTRLDGTVHAVAQSGAPGTQTATATASTVSGATTVTWLGVSVPPPGAQPSTPGSASGGGFINAPGKRTFGFEARYAAGATAPSGSVSFDDKASMKMRADDIERIVIDGQRATITGAANGGGMADLRFSLVVTDQGTPGRNGDTFALTITRVSDPLYRYETSGPLAGGNIQVRQA